MPEPVKKPLVVLTYVVLILSTLLVYWQVRSFDFVNYDDNTYVYENPHVSGGLTKDGIIWAFSTSHAANWHPLTWLSLMLDCQLFSANPGWMHLVNIFLHLANTLLLFAVLRKMTGTLWQSAFVAAAFALHPMHVESVAWITERKDVLSTLFMLLTVAAYAGYLRKPTAYRYLTSLALFACGLMAKPMLVTLPLLLLLLDYWPLNRFDAQPAKTAGRQSRDPVPTPDRQRVFYRILLEKVPFFAVAAVSSAITFLVQRASGAVAGSTMLPLHSRAANAMLSYVKYIGKLFWPDNLAVFYPLDALSIQYWQVALCALLMVAVSVLVIRFRRKQYLLAGWFWFVVALIPVIGFVQSGAQALADRYTYIPYIGLFIMIAWGLPELLSRWPQRKTALTIAAAVTLAAMGIVTWQQVGYWKSDMALFTYAIKAAPNNYVAYSNRGSAYARLGRWQEAIDAYKESLSIKPDYAEAYNNLGFVYGKLGRWQEANDYLREAIRLKPGSAEAYNNCALAYYGLGRYQDAIDAHKRAVELQPDFADARYNLANELAQQGRLDEAADQYHAALKLRPDWPDCMNNLAYLIAAHPQLKNRDINEAVRLATRACEPANNPGPAFVGTLAIAYASAGRFSEAIDTANKALSLADAANQPLLREAILYQLSFYKQGKPYLEPASAPDSTRK